MDDWGDIFFMISIFILVGSCAIMMLAGAIWATLFVVRYIGG